MGGGQLENFPLDTIPDLVKSEKMSLYEGYEKCEMFIHWVVNHWARTVYAERLRNESTVDISDIYQEIYIVYYNLVESYLNDPEIYKRNNFTGDLRWGIVRVIRTMLGVHTKGLNDVLLNSTAVRLDAQIGLDGDGDDFANVVPSEIKTDLPAINSVYNCELAKELSIVLEDLPEKSKNVINQHYFKGLTLSTIAEQNGEPLDTVIKTLTTTLRTLRREETMSRLRKYKV